MTIMTVKTKAILPLLLVALILPLSGCGIFFGDDGWFRNRSGDYLKADNIAPLKLDENLDKSALGELYPIAPLSISELESLSASYDVPRPLPLSANMLEESVKIQRLGGETWILMNVAPGEIWPRLRSFLNVNGLAVARADTSSGIIETDWVQFKTDLNTYDRYRLQVDQGVQPDTSEIHITHMSIPSGTEPSQNLSWPASSVDAERERWLLDELAATLASDTTEAGTSLLAQTIGGTAKAGLASINGEPVLRLRLERTRALGTLSHAAKQEGFSLYESNAAQGIFYVHYRRLDPDGPGWFARKWSGFRNSKAITGVFGVPEDEAITLKSPYTLAELSAQLPRGEAFENPPLTNRKQEKNLPDAPGYLIIVTGEDQDLVVRIRDPYGKRLEARQTRELLTVIRKNLI
jgi:outer membrane protein assembly factor BamC